MKRFESYEIAPIARKPPYEKTRVKRAFFQDLAALPTAIGDTPLAQVIRGHFHLHAVTGKDTNVMFTHLSGNMGGDHMVVVQLYPEGGIGQGFDNRAFHFEMIFFGHGFAVARNGKRRILPICGPCSKRSAD